MCTRSLARLCLLVLAAAAPCLGRPVYEPPLQEMWAQADVVAVLRPLATTRASDLLGSTGPRGGPVDPENYRAMNTRCEVVLVMKTAEGLRDWRTNELTVLHFRYAPNVPEFNGGRFIFFHPAATKLEVVVEGEPDRPVAQDAQPTYLAFLKRGRDGRFIPVTGHYDSEPSFRILSTPVGGAIRYALKENAGKP